MTTAAPPLRRPAAPGPSLGHGRLEGEVGALRRGVAAFSSNSRKSRRACAASTRAAHGGLGAGALKEQGSALQASALVLEDVVPERVGIGGRQVRSAAARVVEQCSGEGVEPFHFAEDASDVLFHYGVVGHAKAQELGGGGDGEQRLAQLPGDAGGDLADSVVVGLGARGRGSGRRRGRRVLHARILGQRVM